MSGVMRRTPIVAGLMLALLLTGCGATAKREEQQTPEMRQAVRDAGRRLDRAAAELQRTAAGVGVDTSGCHPRASLVGCYVASPDAFRPVIAAYAQLRPAATIPDVGTTARCKWAGFRMDCPASAKSHTCARAARSCSSRCVVTSSSPGPRRAGLGREQCP